MNNDTFQQRLQQWILLDNELKLLNERAKRVREQRNAVEAHLVDYAMSHDMDSAPITIQKDKLRIVESRVTEPLTFKYLERSLGEIIRDEAKVKLIVEHVKQKREVRVVPEIKRYSLH